MAVSISFSIDLKGLTFDLIARFGVCRTTPDYLRGDNDILNRKANKLVIAHPKAPSAAADVIAESSAQEIGGIVFLARNGAVALLSEVLPAQHLRKGECS